MQYSAILLALLPLAAQACLRITGHGERGATTQVKLRTEDNGVQTCVVDPDGHAAGGQGVAECVQNFNLRYDWDDNPTTDRLPIEYCNEIQCFPLKVPAKCNTTKGGDCCNGNPDCACTKCDWNLSIFDCKDEPIDGETGVPKEHDS